MPAVRFGAHYASRWFAVILSTSVVAAQTCLVLSPASIDSDGSTTLDLAVYTVAGTRPTAIQWTFQYPSTSIKKLIVEDGPALKSVGKTAVCAGDTTAYKCLTVGTAEEVIQDGIIARIAATLAPGAVAADISIKDALGTSPSGHVILISSKVKPAGSGAGEPSDCAESKPRRQPPK